MIMNVPVLIVQRSQMSSDRIVAVAPPTMRYVNVQPYEELVAADPRTLHFTPLGLFLDGQMSPQAAATFQQQAIASVDLHEQVPDGVRMSFDRLRTIHSHGVIFYDAFSIVSGMRWIVLEQALRERFIQFYKSGVTLTHVKRGSQQQFSSSSFEDLNQKCRELGRAWKLQPGQGLSAMSVPLTLGPLLRWARLVGLLDGQRNRPAEGQMFEQIRNRFAHGAGYELVSPVDSVRAIHDLAEVINKLWGVPTPGGRLYSDGQDREQIVLAWTGSSDGGRGAASIMLPAVAMMPDPGLDGCTFLVVLGSLNDGQLLDFDVRYELTTYTTDLLWGPGDRDGLRAFLGDCDDSRDRCTTVDRVFAVRHLPGVVYLPHSPAILLGLPEDRQEGTWHLVRSDFGLDAFNHVRHLVSDGHQIAADTVGCCTRCPVETLSIGSWVDVCGATRKLLPLAKPRTWANVGVPRTVDYPSSVGFG